MTMTAARRRRVRLARPLPYLLALAYAALALAPVAFMLLIALQPASSLGEVSLEPARWRLGNFAAIWGAVELGLYIRNSLLVAVLTGALASLVALGAGYVVARFRFPLRNAFRISLLASHTVPSLLLLLPIYVGYIVIQNLLHVHIVGGYPGVVVTYMTFALPFAIWMLSIYVSNLPVDIEEQAMVDGATRTQVLRHVMLPLAVPGLVVTFVFSFLLAWNDVLFASVLTSPATRTLGVGLQYYLSENYGLPQWNLLMAASAVSALPAVVLFMLVQRYIVQGLASGSVKG